LLIFGKLLIDLEIYFFKKSICISPHFDLGASFYPIDIKEKDFQIWLSSLDEDTQAKATSYVTVIQRDADSFKIVPYNQVYAALLANASEKLLMAANATNCISLKDFLTKRAAGNI
jgi:hypothetical protein